MQAAQQDGRARGGRLRVRHRAPPPGNGGHSHTQDPADGPRDHLQPPNPSPVISQQHKGSSTGGAAASGYGAPGCYLKPPTEVAADRPKEIQPVGRGKGETPPAGVG
jgi:hypothetical protein